MPHKQTQRCAWVTQDPLDIEYHDQEWGVPVRSDLDLFEKIQLEVMQAGLSWITVLKRRAFFREATHDFDPHFLATLKTKQLEKWLKDPRFIRHHGKLKAWVQNAKSYLRLQQQQSFTDFLWDFVEGHSIQHRYSCADQIPSQTPVSQQMSKALKQAGFSFVGPTTCYALMQACGLVNDHLIDCACYPRIQRLSTHKERHV